MILWFSILSSEHKEEEGEREICPYVRLLAK